MIIANVFKFRGLLTGLFLGLFLLGGCMSSEQQQAREVADSFWQAVLDKDMETAKGLVTWE
ncbi:MAG: hypothetical protein CR976_01925, partial [Thiotrichales bacterium]